MWSESSLVFGYCLKQLQHCHQMVLSLPGREKGHGGVAMQDCSQQHKGVGDWWRIRIREYLGKSLQSLISWREECLHK